MPAVPKIYHITHVKNLPSVLRDGGLLSDAEMIKRGGPATTIGMSKIKQRRLSLAVDCHPGENVGDFVPFYFCPRSVMLYLIHKRNSELQYSGGQEPVVHLEADLNAAIDWADQNGVPWAFSLSNAGAFYVEFRKRRDQLVQVNWDAVAATNWAGAREAKQAEFLMHEFFPWHLVQRIGVMSTQVQTQVLHVLAGSEHRPVVEVQRNWYY